MNYNKYNEVINGTETYKGIAKDLLDNKTIGIGWTDEDSTHLDIIVSIIDHTSYGFVSDSIKDGSYIQEKLRFNNDCGNKLAELINGIILEIIKGEQI